MLTHSSTTRVEKPLGSSRTFRGFLTDLERAARTETNVLLRGESGTGKDLCAHAIHRASSRTTGPFVTVDCAGIAESLFDGELFGHSRGAFTGAERTRRGRLLSADGGTLFLDGIDHLSLAAQTRLLRVIQEREVHPLGESRPRPVDFRLVSSATEDFARRLEEGRFRQDLFYRVNVIQLEVPTLRERAEDIALLAQTFLEDIARHFRKPVLRIDERALRTLSTFDWPGNVRELRSVLECAVASMRGEILRESDLPVYVRMAHDSSEKNKPSAQLTPKGDSTSEDSSFPFESFHDKIRAYEQKLLVTALREYRWSYRGAAKALGLSHHQVKYLCAKLGIRRTRFGSEE